MDYIPPGSSVHGILQERMLEWVVMPFSKGSSQPRIEPRVSCIAADSLLSEPSGKPNLSHSKMHSGIFMLALENLF